MTRLQARGLAVVQDEPMEYSTPHLAPRWLILGAGALGAGVIVELIIGLAVAL